MTFKSVCTSMTSVYVMIYVIEFQTCMQRYAEPPLPGLTVELYSYGVSTPLKQEITHCADVCNNILLRHCVNTTSTTTRYFGIH